MRRERKMLPFIAGLMRFFGMYLPSQSMRIAMYRKAGIRIGKVHEFGGGNWLSIQFSNLIEIEDGALLAGHIHVLSHSFLFGETSKYYGSKNEGFFPVRIKKGARIGMSAIILPGATIGENSVIGAGAVVVDDIPPNCVAVGVPAKPISFFGSTNGMSENTIARGTQRPSRHPMLYVKCKMCGVEFDSSIRCNKQIFNSLELRDNRHHCPNGHTDRYNKKDYYYRE
jgi:hypothetical protein